MKRWFFAFVFIISFVFTGASVQAQTPVEIDQLQVDIWPEFDRPEVLVIYHIIISANSTLPAQISMRIPRRANSPYNVAMKDVDGMLYNLQYDQTIEGDWSKISFTAASTELQIEYYDPSLTIDGTTRNFVYQWPGDYRVLNMNLRIQQPFNASNLQLTNGTLKIANGALGDDGLTYYSVPIDGMIEAGTTFDVPFSYTKPDAVLSSSQAPVQAVKTSTGNATLGSSLTPANETLLIGLAAGAVLILIGFIWYLNQQRLMASAAMSNNRRRHSNVPKHGSGDPFSTGDTIYCHQCGKRASTQDAFCRSCGTRLRSD